MPFFNKKNTKKITEYKNAETQTENFYENWTNEVEEIGWDEGDSTPFNEQNSTLEEQSTESIVRIEDKNFISLIPTTEYENRSNDSQQTLNEEDTSFNKIFLNLFLFFFIIITPYFFIRIFFFVIWFYNFQEIFIKLRLSKEDFIYELDPLKINFTQSTISPWFRGYDGYSVEETTKDLINSKLNPKDLPIIRVCIIDGEFFSADNRRLYCLKEAVKNGAKFKKVAVQIVRETDKRAGFKRKMEGSLIVQSETNWSTVIISDHACAGRAIDNYGKSYECIN
jgi:hypothetical protein